MSRHPRADLYLADREKGLTYRKIAEKYGVSYQAVACSCSRQGGRFVPFTVETCVYPMLRQWLNENEINVSEFVRRIGEIPRGAEHTRFKAYFRGEHYPSKQTIDRMLQVTGLTYEQLFCREDKDA